MKDLKNQKHYLINFKNKLINTKEIIDAILLHLDLNGKEGFNIGNALKYIIRYKYKNGIEDLKKARNFLDYEIGDSPQETIKALENELNKVIDRNIELEMINERLKNKVHNLHLDLNKHKKLKDIDTKELIKELITRDGVHDETGADLDWFSNEITILSIRPRSAFKTTEDSNEHQIDAWTLQDVAIRNGRPVSNKYKFAIKK